MIGGHRSRDQMLTSHWLPRYKQDLVRRKDKVKARNAENKRNNK